MDKNKREFGFRHEFQSDQYRHPRQPHIECDIKTTDPFITGGFTPDLSKFSTIKEENKK